MSLILRQAPSTPQTINNGATTSFTVTPVAGYSASVGGTCGGTLNGITYTTNPITANCTVTATFTLPSDFNGDAHPDVLWQHQATGSLSVWLMNGTSLATLATVTPGVVSDTNWKIVGIAVGF